MNALQSKISRLERMTPKRSPTPKRENKMTEMVMECERPVVLFDREEIKNENISMSQVTAVS